MFFVVKRLRVQAYILVSGLQGMHSMYACCLMAADMSYMHVCHSFILLCASLLGIQEQ